MGVALALAAVLFAQASAEDVEPIVISVEAQLPERAEPKLVERVRGLVQVRREQRLSRRAVQRTIEGIYATGRFDDVVARTYAVDGGVRLVFELTLKQRIIEVYFDGARALPRTELQAAVDLKETAEYWPERISLAAETLRELYRRRGFHDVTVDTHVNLAAEGASVGFEIDEGPPSLVRSLTFSGDPGLPTTKLLNAMGVRPGDRLDLARLSEGLEQLRKALRTEHFYRARIEAPQTNAAGEVVVPMLAGPRYEIVFTGNRALSTAVLKATLAYDGDETLDDGLRLRLAQRLARAYRFRGFHDVKVRGEEITKADGRLGALGFVIEEGLPLRVTRLDFDGNTAIADAELKEVLRNVVERSAPQVLGAHAMGDGLDLEGRGAPVVGETLPSPPGDTVFDEDAWGEAAKAMMALYRERGFLFAKVRFDQLQVDRGNGAARFVVEEGERVQFGTVIATGVPEGFTSSALQEKRSGQVFSEAQLDAIRQTVLRDLSRKGYLYAKADATYGVDAKSLAANCTITVTKGPKVVVRKVLPVGNLRTHDDTMLGQATMLEGAALDSDTLSTTQSNLLGLGYFRTVQVEMLSAETPEPLKTVLLKVKEYPPVYGDLSPGYFLADGPRIVVDGAAPNIGGSSISLSAHVLLSYYGLSAPALLAPQSVADLEWWKQFGGRGNVSVSTRGLLPANIGLRLDAVGERVFRPQFRFTHWAGVASTDWSRAFEVPGIDWARPKVSLQLQGELEWTDVQRTGTSLVQELPVSLADQERLRFSFGTFPLVTGRFAPTLDFRDSPLVPRKGFLLQGSVELTKDIGAVDQSGNPVQVSFVKLAGQASGYVPITSSVVLAVSGRAGRILPLTAGSVTPPVKRFFLGGATSMRGFNEDQLLPEDLRAQYRGEVRDCSVVATPVGCTSASRAVASGRQVPSLGGELFALLKTEVRISVLKEFELAPFFEAGNLFLSAPKSGFPLRTVAGLGFRYVTPIGPLAVDVGFNLSPDRVVNEPPVVVHFNIGVF